MNRIDYRYIILSGCLLQTFENGSKPFTVIHVFLAVLFLPFLDFGRFKSNLFSCVNTQKARAVVLLSCLLFPFGSIAMVGDYGMAINNTSYVPLNLQSQISLASTGSSDLFFVQNASEAEGNMDAATVVKMATSWGSAVLGIEDEVGTIEIGKKADIIVVDLRSPHLVPLYHPFSALVYSANGADVRDVIVNGRLLLRDRTFQTLDPDEIMERVRALTSTFGVPH